MINKKKFDLLLQEIFQIEDKIEEMKILNQFDKANEFNSSLDELKTKAKDIVIDDNAPDEFDDLSVNVLYSLIKLNSDVDYYVLKVNNIIASVAENKIDAEALKKIKKLWEALEEDLESWELETHNPIKEIEHNKQVGKTTLDIIIYRLQIEAVIDFTEVFKYCKKEYLVNAIKEALFEGARVENDSIKRQLLIDSAKKMSEKELYNYKLWQQLLIIKNVRSRDDHLEIIGNILEKDNKKKNIENVKQEEANKKTEEEEDLDLYYYDSIFTSIKKWFKSLNESVTQNKMFLNWRTINGPAFKAIFEDENVKFSKEFLDKNTIENVKKLEIATNGVAKYHFEKGATFKKLEELEFLNGKATASVNLSPDKTYSCIGNDAFAECETLKKLSLGNIEMIGERAFKNCKNLSEVYFSPLLKNIGENAFLNCEKITRVEFLGNLETYILNRPQNILNCFKGTNLEEIVFSNIDCAFNFAITDCPYLKRILVSNIPNIQIPFKTCKYRLGRQEGIVSFVGEKALDLWKKKNTTIRFFELTDEDKEKYNMK